MFSLWRKWDTITDAGLNPLPVQRPIPIWIGGGAEATLRRVARMADGWFPQLPPNDEARGMVERLRGYIEAEGRPLEAVGLEARLSISLTP